MSNPQQQIDGDVLVTGKLTVLDGINDTDISEVQAIAQATNSEAILATANVSGILGVISDLESDSKLTPSEKLVVEREWTNIENEYPQIKLRAEECDIEAGNTHYDNYVVAYEALDSYLNTDPTGVIFNLTTTTTITGGTLRTNFATYFAEREDLLLEGAEETPTYKDLQGGYINDPAYATKTPETPLWDDIAADKQDIVLRIYPQYVANGYTKNLTNFWMWEWQVSADQSSWYALRFDGDDWKGTLNTYTEAFGPTLIHTNIPNTGNPPTGRTLYYRCRTVTRLADGTRGTESGYSATQSAATVPILSWNETIPPENGTITNLSGDTYADVTVTFTVGDDTHSGTYVAAENSGLAGHRIWRRLNSGGTDIRIVGDVKSATQTTFVDVSPLDGIAYDYGISAYDINTNESTIAWYGTPITPQYTAPPDTVATITAVASPEKVVISWSPVGGPVGPYVYDVERATNLTNWASFSTDVEESSIEDDIGEVEYSMLANYRYRVKAQDTHGNLSAAWASTSAAPTRDDSYGTWTPATVAAGEVHATGSNRSIGVSLDRQGADTPTDHTDDLINEVGIAIQISINDTNWYEPAFERAGSTDVNRWYTGAENAYAEISELAFALRNLPLTSESGGGPVTAETYYLRFKRRRYGSGGITLSGSWSSSVSVVCTATGAADVVANAFKQSQMDMTDWFLLDGTGLVGYWSLNDIGIINNVDLEIKDNSGNGHHGTASAQLTAVDGPAGPCPHLNGSSDYISIPDHADYNFGTGDFSVCFWMNSDDTPAAVEYIVAKRSATANRGWWTERHTDGKIRFYIGDGAADDGCVSDSDVGNGSVFVVAVRISAVLKLYINGVLQADDSVASDGDVDVDPNSINIGRNPQGSNYHFDGLIGHVRTLNRGLSQGEARWLYQNPTGNVPEMFLAHRIATGSLLAEHLSVLSKDHINNPTKTGNLAGWGHHDEYGRNTGATALTLETGLSFGGRTIKGMRITDDNLWGIRSKSFKIDQSKIYKVQWTVKSSAAAARHYCGLGVYASLLEADEADSSGFSAGTVLQYADDDRSSGGTISTNFYFVSAKNVSADWTTYTSYIVGYDRAITDVPTVTADYYAKMTYPDQLYCHLRFLLWSAVASSTHDIINVSVQEVGSGTVVAENIAVVSLAAIKANLGAVTDGALNINSHNYWALDDSSLGGHVTGDFRVGDADSFILFDAATNELTLKIDTIYISSLVTRVKGTALEIADSGDLESGLTNPVQIGTENTGAKAFVDHPTQIDLRINGSDIVSLTGSSVTVGVNTVTVGSAHPVIVDGSTGILTVKGSGGAWATGYKALGSADTDRGGFGFLGSTDVLTYYWIGASHSSTGLRVYPSGYVAVGNFVPSYRLHMYAATGALYGRVESGDGSDVGWYVKNSVRSWLAYVEAAGNYAIRDVTASVTPFTIEIAAPANSLWLDANGCIGHLISTPIQALHLHETGTGANYLHFSNTTTGTTDTDGIDIGLNVDEKAYVWNFENTDMVLATNNVARVTIQAAGNIGFRTTDIEAWDAAYAVLEFPESAIMASLTTGAVYWLSNAYYDGAWKFKDAGWASRIYQGAGANFYIGASSASGAANGAITWRAQFSIDNEAPALSLAINDSGYVGVGIADGDCLLHVYKGSAGAIAAHAYSHLTLEHSDHAMISILTPNTKTAYFAFGDVNDSYRAGMTYNHSTDELSLMVNDDYGLKFASDSDVYFEGLEMHLGYDISAGSYHGSDTKMYFASAKYLQYDVSADEFLSTSRLRINQQLKHRISDTQVTENTIFDGLAPYLSSDTTYPLAIHGMGTQGDLVYHIYGALYVDATSFNLLTSWIDPVAGTGGSWICLINDGDATVRFGLLKIYW